ncbi:hypothetical protein [Candidatus Poriferisodalis sp.]|uniref:hypothetical protein n=1 Tax=Candidatus Poriferisodalis sp. TaxID=3101277 RepID=UPI003B5B1C81
MDTQIGSLRADMNTQGASLRADMDAQFREVSAILLDHTDRLARIETHLDIQPRPDAPPVELQGQPG